MDRKILKMFLIYMILVSSFSICITITPPVKSDYTLHDPISIDGNEDFAAQAAEEGWPGDGTEGNPYVIEGYEISTTSSNGIQIMSTNVHFVIRDSLIKGGFYEQNDGINFNNVENGVIENCTLEMNQYGIFLNSSYKVNINENLLSDNWKSGIHLVDSNDNSVMRNNITDCGCGLQFISSHKNTIVSNNISFTWDVGIYLYCSKQNYLIANTMDYCGIFIDGYLIEHWNTHNIEVSNKVYGKPIYYWKNRTSGTMPQGAGQVILANCSGIEIADQEILYVSTGIELGFSQGCSILNSSICKNDAQGLYLYHSNDNDIMNNNISHNRVYGIYLDKSNGNIITNNKALTGDGGIYLNYSGDNDILNNDISSTSIYHSDKGIYLINSTGNNIEKNHIFGIGDAVYLHYCRENKIINNNVSKANYRGIRLIHSDWNEINNNHVSNSNWNGIYLEYSIENNIINNSVSNNHDGICLTHSQWNNLTNNMVSANDDNGMFLYNSTWNNISANQAISNNISGIGLSCSNSNSIQNNNLSKNKKSGIYLIDSNENNINENIIFNNRESGAYFLFSNQSVLIGNTISTNGCGIHLYCSQDNVFHHNEIVGNTIQVNYISNYENIWHDGQGEGNYWSDYKGVDTDGDGVGDTTLPHQGVDYFPLCEPNKEEEDIFSFLSDRKTLSNIAFGCIIILLIFILIRWIRNLKKIPLKNELKEDVEQLQESPDSSNTSKQKGEETR